MRRDTAKMPRREHGYGVGGEVPSAKKAMVGMLLPSTIVHRGMGWLAWVYEALASLRWDLKVIYGGTMGVGRSWRAPALCTGASSWWRAPT